MTRFPFSLGALLAALVLPPAVLAAVPDPPDAGIVIDGPAPPVAPATLARDAQGRVTVRAVRIEAPLRLDGALDEPWYRSVEPLEDFIQQEPDEGQPGTERTRVWVLFDEHYLYIAARCDDSQASRIVANDMRRDGRNIGQNDNLSIVLDTFYDRRNGYEFLVNGVGGVQDSQITDERDVNRDWNAVVASGSRLDDQGWSVELAIPFRSLRYRGAGPQVWGLNVRRTVRWKNEFAYLSPVPRTQGVRGILKLSSAGTLVGLDLPPASVNLDVKPYALASARADRALDPSFANEYDGDAGFDLKYGLTRSLTADFTYRTDFAQVEDDDQVVNLTRFTQFFPEKREFFLEGQGIFAFGGAGTTARGAPTNVNTPVLFFSRRIGIERDREVPIDAGGRVTGKVGKFSVGLLDIQVGDREDIGSPATNIAVVRLKRDILRRSYVGVIGTSRSPATLGDGRSYTAGVDAGLSFYESINIVGSFAQTSTPELRGDDQSHRLRFDYDADLVGLQVERLAVGENFRPEVGFLRRRDFIQHVGQLRLSRRPARWPSVRKMSLEAGLDYITDGDRQLENRLARMALRTERQSGDSWLVEYERVFEFLPVSFDIVPGVRLPVGAYHYSTVRGSYQLGSQRRVSGTITAARGSFYDGTRTDVGYSGRIEANRRLSLEPGITVNDVDLPEGRFTAKLLTGRGTFSFTPRLWVAALVQYNSTSRIASTNVRFRWEYLPGSDLFVVYSDGRDTGLERPLPRLQSRTFTVKLTRLFRF